MTVTYTHHVASSKGFGCFWKLLFRWRGSIYKLVWPDLIIYVLLYSLCSVIYRVVLDEAQKRSFENVAIHCQQFTDLIPVAFVLGFYVSIVVQRWWEQYMSLPWPDALALFVSTCIVGQDERSRVMRRTIMRYVNLTFVITLSMISPRVKKRFPTLDHVMEAGFMTAQEKKIFEDLNRKTSHPKYWMPLVWAGTIVSRARKEGRIRDDFAVKSLIDEISKFRGLSGGLLSYDWISIPLVYTQVVTLAVYTFFIGTIMGRQFLDPARNIPNYTVDFYVPWFTFLQFFFYMGWLKVAESLVNPFGEDDDDFEVNWLIDRNFQVSYLIVDEMHEEHPELIQDVYWDEVFPQNLPYTVASEGYRRMAPQGSTFNMQVPEAEQEILLMPLDEEDEDEGKDSGHVKINMQNARASRESLQSSSSGIAMKVRSPRNSISGDRKGSMLSVLLNRVMHSGDPGPARFSRLGSSLSIRSKRASRVQRNSSRLSAVSRVSSRDSLSTPRPRGLPSSASVARCAVSGDESAPEMSQRWLNREVSMDEEGAILIRIKPDSERKARLVKSEVASTKSSTTVPTSTSSQSPASSKHPATTLPSSTSSTSMTTRASLAKLPPLPIAKRTSPARPNLTALQTGSVSSSAGTGSHLLSQELGSDDEVQTPWGVSDPSSPDCGDDRDTGTVRRKGKVGNPQDDPPTSARSQPCPSEDAIGDLLSDASGSGPLQRGVSVPGDWPAASNDSRMFNFLGNKDQNDPSRISDPGWLDQSQLKKDPPADRNEGNRFFGGQSLFPNIDEGSVVYNFETLDLASQPACGSYPDSSASVPASPTSKVPTREPLFQPVLEPDSSSMSLSDRFSNLIKDTNAPVVGLASEPDGPPISLHSRKTSSIPEGLDVVNEENEAIEEDCDDDPPVSNTPLAHLLSSDPDTTASTDVKTTAASDLPEPALFISESSNALSFEGRP